MNDTKTLSQLLTQADYIKLLCANEDVTLTELAERIGKSQPNLSNMLSRSDFRISDMEKIAKALGYKFTYTFTKEF